MFTKAMELAPSDFEIAFTAAGYLRYIYVNFYSCSTCLEN